MQGIFNILKWSKMFNWWLKTESNGPYDMREHIDPKYVLPADRMKANVVSSAVYCQTQYNENQKSRRHIPFPVKWTHQIVNNLVTEFDFIRYIPRVSPNDNFTYVDVEGNEQEQSWCANTIKLRESMRGDSHSFCDSNGFSESHERLGDEVGVPDGIQNEILRHIMTDLRFNAGTIGKGKRITWERINNTAAIMEGKTGYTPNWIITTPELACSLKIDCPRYNTIFASRGPMTRGFNIVIDPLLPQDQLVLTTNQNSKHGGYFWSFYAFATTELIVDHDSFCARRSYMMRYAKRMVRGGADFTATLCQRGVDGIQRR